MYTLLNNTQSIFLLILRLFWGSFFLWAGLQKLMDISSIANFLNQVVPFGTVQAYAVAIIEFLGGLFLILGFLSRIAAIPLIIVMIGALYLTNFDVLMNFFSEPLKLTQQAPFTFLMVSLIILFFGPGKYSLDYILKLEKGD